MRKTGAMKIGARVLMGAVTMAIPQLAFSAEPAPTPGPAPTPAAAAPAAGSAYAPVARSLVVFDPIGIGVEESQIQSVGEIERDAFGRLGYRVVPRSEMPAGTCADELCAAREGRALNVAEAVVLKLSRLESKVLVIGSIIDVGAGRIEFSDRATATTLDDMDAIIPRVADALAHRVPFASTITPETVTLNEAREPRRQKAFFTTGLRIGGLLPTDGSYGGVTGLYGAEWVNFYEVRQFSIEAALGGRWSPSSQEATATEWYADLGASYYLTDADVSPFVGGGVGLHGVAARWRTGFDTTGAAVYESDAQSGLGLWAGAGVTMLRTADVHVVAVAKYTVDTFEIDGRVPQGVMLGLAVTYTKRGNTCCLW